MENPMDDKTPPAKLLPVPPIPHDKYVQYANDVRIYGSKKSGITVDVAVRNNPAHGGQPQQGFSFWVPAAMTEAAFMGEFSKIYKKVNQEKRYPDEEMETVRCLVGVQLKAISGGDELGVLAAQKQLDAILAKGKSIRLEGLKKRGPKSGRRFRKRDSWIRKQVLRIKKEKDGNAFAACVSLRRLLADHGYRGKQYQLSVPRIARIAGVRLAKL